MTGGDRAAFAAVLASVRRELRRVGGPERVVLVAIPAEVAAELRVGIAVERVRLVDHGGRVLPELIVSRPERPPELLRAWGPTAGTTRQGPR